MSASKETLTFARTKIQPPRLRSGLLARTNLSERIAKGLLHSPLTLISAAGGFGKSSAVAQALSAHTNALHFAWINCETSDTLGRFASAFVAALDPFDPPWRTSPDALISGLEVAESRRAFRDALINALSATDVTRAVIVLDDAHRLQDDRLHEFLADLPEHLPENWSIALITREDPPWSLARLRASGQLAEIRQDDLRFDAADVEALAKQSGKQASAETLMSRTEGWAVGIALALASDGKTSLVRSERHAIEYLQSEVLAALPERLHSFLVQTSVLPELTASRCAAVTGREDSDECLDEIERRGLFFQEVEGHDRAIRLHDIFRDALAALRSRLPQDERRSLWKRAAESEADATRRIEYLIASEDFDAAVAEFALTAPQLMTAGQTGLARTMLARFPKAVSDTSTELAILRGLMAWESMNIPLMIEEMKTALAHSRLVRDERSREILESRAKAYVNLALTNLAPVGQSNFDEQFAVAIEEQTDPRTRVVVSLERATRAFDLARLEDANNHYNEALANIPRANDPSLRLQLLPATGYVGLRELEPLLNHYSNGALAAAGDEFPTLRAVALGLRGSVAMWRGELAFARSTLDEAISLTAWINRPMNVCFYTYVPHLWCRTLQGEIDAATNALRQTVDEIRAFHGTLGVASWYFYWIELRAAIMADRPDIARRAIESIRRTISPQETERLKGPAFAFSGMEAMLSENYGEARHFFSRVLAQYGTNDALGITTSTRLLLTKIELASGNNVQSLSLAKEALATIRARGYPLAARFAGASAIRAISDPEFTRHYNEAEHETLEAVRQWLPEVIEARAEGREHSAATQGNDASEQRQTSRNPQSAANVANHETVVNASRIAQEAISPREMEVLELIAAGESNKIIARRLDLSPHTVKRHVANILGKH
jgi:LuxR family maltose regulon positive regulatory protein